MIPTENSEAVIRGLRATFGVTELEDISRITKGHTSSLVFRIIVRRSPYLLKIITRAEDQTRHYTVMKAAAEGGVAPRVLYASIPDHVFITDFVETVPLSISEALIRLPGLLRTLHALPPFAKAPFNTTCTFLIHKGPTLDGFLQKFRAANAMPEQETEELFARYAQLAEAYACDESDLVSCHNDLFKPDNILFDGHRLWLVDWEAAFLNDRYADLAVVANQVVSNEEEEAAYLERYFGAPPDRYQLARFHLMQQLVHVFYTMGLLYLGSKDTPVDWTIPVPELRDYHRRMWAGEVNVAAPAVKVTYARVHWERLLQNVRSPRYEEALRLCRFKLMAHQRAPSHRL
jgi:aminoglycoside phosphotransferase